MLFGPAPECVHKRLGLGTFLLREKRDQVTLVSVCLFVVVLYFNRVGGSVAVFIVPPFTPDVKYHLVQLCGASRPALECHRTSYIQ